MEIDNIGALLEAVGLVVGVPLVLVEVNQKLPGKIETALLTFLGKFWNDWALRGSVYFLPPLLIVVGTWALNVFIGFSPGTFSEHPPPWLVLLETIWTLGGVVPAWAALTTGAWILALAWALFMWFVVLRGRPLNLPLTKGGWVYVVLSLFVSPVAVIVPLCLLLTRLLQFWVSPHPSFRRTVLVLSFMTGLTGVILQIF